MRDMNIYKEQIITELRGKVGGKKVLLALSGGVDCSVCAALLSQAGADLTCIFVDHGCMRKNEAAEVKAAFADRDLKLVQIDAADRFLEKLAGVTEPEQKRKLIGAEFIRVFEEEARKIGAVDFLAQGTIYPDVIESDEKIKSHHNVGGLPDCVDFKEIVEPVRELYKNEVRELGRLLGLPECITERQPFPGPGLAIRVIGEVTRGKLDILREADFIFRDEVKNAGLDKNLDQYFAALTDMRAVGVRDGKRTYGYVAALRAVKTVDFMTAEFARVPYEVLEKAAARITGIVGGEGSDGISRVLFDVTDKPPGTVEFE